MNRLLSTFLLLISNIDLTAQILNVDSLVNYSYKIQGVNIESTSPNSKAIVHKIDAGTCFIVAIEGNDFLITNYHVITGKDPYTNKKIPRLSDTCTSFLVNFRNNYDTGFSKPRFDLYTRSGHRNYPVFHYNEDTVIDITAVILPNDWYPPNINKYIITQSEIDSEFNYQGNETIYVLGFPLGKMIEGWKPNFISASSVNLNHDSSVINPYLFYNQISVHGMSGSPVYIKKTGSNKILLKGIQAIQTRYDSNNPDIKAAAINFHLALKLIEEILKTGKSNVDYYFQKYINP